MKFFNFPFNLYVDRRKIFSTSLVAFIIGVLLGGILWNFSYMPTFTTEPGEPPSPTPSTRTQTHLLRFSSYDELKSFLSASSQVPPYNEGVWLTPFGLTSDLDVAAMESTIQELSVSGYSTTNIQIEGVDEADVVKTDGDYIYVVSGKSVVIVKAYPPEEARVLSQIGLNETLREIFINGDKLVVFAEERSFIDYEIPTDNTTFILPLTFIPPYETLRTSIKVYNVSDRENPVLKRNISLDGWYFNSRMIGDYVYTVINQPAYYIESEVALPIIYSDDRVEEIPAPTIYYADVSDNFYTFTTIVAINVQNDEQEPAHETFLLGWTSSMYVSLSNIYITFPEVERTLIYRIHVEGDEIVCEASGNVSGVALNQFSMDEYKGYFRIATTTGRVGSSQNNVYVLDMNLNIVGRLEDLAPGEAIYSARFMGDRCYLVTFRRVDPFFVIDLEAPDNPKVLGVLKIPGYSDYLHPYDENHIIGIGKEGTNVKISLFDVSNVSDPKEIHKYLVSGEWSDSSVLRDHKAFLFDKSKNLLVIPVSITEIGVRAREVDKYSIWQGVYVFNITLDEGLVLKGGITHLENGADPWASNYWVKRSLYIDNVLYTISDNKIKINSLENLDEINEVEFP